MSSAILSRWAALAGLLFLAGCQTTGGNVPPPGAQSRLTGSVTYRERMALPPDATIAVRLEDVSRADAPATVIAEQKIVAEGRQVPIPFELSYAPEGIEPNRRHALRAEIRDAEGTLLFTTTTQHAALVAGAPTDNIEIRVERVAATPTATDAPIGDWRLIAIQKAGAPEVIVSDDLPYTMSFGSDGRVSGKAHCNSYGGAYAARADGQLKITGMAATLMACMAPSLADAFLVAVGEVSRYETDEAGLRLTTAGGTVLRLTRPSVTASPPPEAAPTDPASTPEASLATVASPGLSKPWVDAASRGVRFRALGNEPSWVLEITDKSLTMITDLGQRKTGFALAAPVVKGDTTIWRSGGTGEGLVAVVQRKPCADDMSGEAMDAIAAVTFEGATYKGCGRFLD